jgi:hypothetical protein
MMVIEQYSEIRRVQVGVDAWGEPIFEMRRVNGRREVEMPDVITQEEALAREPARLAHEAKLARLPALKDELIEWTAAAAADEAGAKSKLKALLAELRQLWQELEE